MLALYRIWLYLTLLILPTACFAQKLDTTIVRLPFKDTLVTYEKTIRLDSSITKEKLYEAAMAWAKLSTNRVVKVSNTVTGAVAGLSYMEIPTGSLGISKFGVWCLFSIKVKDDGYTLKFFDFARKSLMDANARQYIHIEGYYNTVRNGQKTGYRTGVEKTFFKILDQKARALLTEAELFFTAKAKE